MCDITVCGFNALHHALCVKEQALRSETKEPAWKAGSSVAYVSEPESLESRAAAFICHRVARGPVGWAVAVVCAPSKHPQSLHTRSDVELLKAL